jgi:NCS1 family nucleobase:cation symporter-1
MATSLYTGPVSAFLGGADLSWVAGLVVTGPLYLLVARRGSGAKITTTTREPARL